MEQKTIPGATEAFQQNVNNAIKWFTDTTTAVNENYSKQFDIGVGLYKKFIGTTMNLETDGSTIALFQKNVERVSDLARETMKTVVDAFSKQISAEVPTRDVWDAIMKTSTKQAEMMAAFNQKYFELFGQQLDASGMNFNAFSDKFQKTTDSNLKSWRESIKTIIESYTVQTSSVLETNKALLHEINRQIDSMTESCLKLYLELIATMNDAITAKKQDGDPRKKKSS